MKRNTKLMKLTSLFIFLTIFLYIPFGCNDMENIFIKYSKNILLFFVTFFVAFILFNIENIINKVEYTFTKPLLIALVPTVISFFGKKKAITNKEEE